MNYIIGKQYFEIHKIEAIQGNIAIPAIKNLPIPRIDIYCQTRRDIRNNQRDKGQSLSHVSRSRSPTRQC